MTSILFAKPVNKHNIVVCIQAIQKQYQLLVLIISQQHQHNIQINIIVK